MRLLLQRVRHASVRVEEEIVGQIQNGFLVLVGLGKHDTEKESQLLAKKLVNLRVFEDSDGKMNLSLLDVRGEALLVSQFTLFADCKKGRRPSFNQAMEPESAKKLFDSFCQMVKNSGIKIATGSFGAKMEVLLCNDGPVTLWLDSNAL